MTLGISTYAYQWRLSDRGDRPWTVEQLLDDVARLGVTLVQLCDLPELEAMARDGVDTGRLDALRGHADRLGIALEVGTKGIRPAHHRAYLDIAQRLGSPILRSMLVTPDYRPTREEAERDLGVVLPDFERAGIVLALETYEQVATAELVDLAATFDTPTFGICLDPGNVIARLEHPREVVEITAPWVRNVHVKDFAFRRSDDMVGFRFAGVPMGEGLLDYAHLVATVRPDERGISRIIEQWVPWQGDAVTTISLETEWVDRALAYLPA
jgi:sugar phosphate isomerase/epimerase